MNYQFVDLLDKVIAKDTGNDLLILSKEGVLASDGHVVHNKLNLMTGAYASDLLDNILEADMNIQEVILFIEGLQQQNQCMGIYFFLLYLFSAFEMDVPYLFTQLPSNIEVLQSYVMELIEDIKDCSLDINQED
jgi:hypothetical protein